MYIHIGQGFVVQSEDVIGIFDLDNTTYSYITRDYLRRCEKGGRVVTIGEELPKSFAVTSKNNEETVYLSQLAPSTLAKRAEDADIE